MIGIDEIRMMNDTMILYLEKMGENTERNEIIKKILQDDACFFKMDKLDACDILEDVGIKKEKILGTYNELISANVFYKLKKAGKISELDSKISFENQGSVDVFKDKRKEPIKQEFKLAEIKKDGFFVKLLHIIKSFFKAS